MITIAVQLYCVLVLSMLTFDDATVLGARVDVLIVGCQGNTGYS